MKNVFDMLTHGYHAIVLVLGMGPSHHWLTMLIQVHSLIKNFIKTTFLVDSNQSKAMHCARLIFSCWYTLMFWKGKTTNMSITIGLPKLGLRQMLLPTEDTNNITILVFVLFFIICRDKLIVLCSRLLMKLGK